MVAEQQHELLNVERGNGFQAAVGGPDASASDGVDVGMKIEAVAVALNGDDDAGDGKGIGGNLLQHLPECLLGRLAEQAEITAVAFENGARELWEGEEVLGVPDLLQDVPIEQLSEEQDALLLA